MMTTRYFPAFLGAWALPMALVTAAEPDTPAPATEKLQQAMCIMRQDGVLDDFVGFGSRHAAVTERMERCARGEESVHHVPWIPIVFALYMQSPRREPSPELLRLLLEAGAALLPDNVSGMVDCILLSRALANPEVAALAARCVDVTARYSPSESTLLHLAVSVGAVEFIRGLLAAGADVHARAASDATPLHVAAMHGCKAEVIALLLAAGADVNAELNAGADKVHTPLDRALLTRVFPEVAGLQLLQEHGGVCRDVPPLVQACVLGNLDFIRKALADGLDVNAAVELFGGSPESLLNMAVLGNRVDVCRALLEAGANARRDSAGQSPLYLAAFLGRSEICRLLLAAGAEADEVALRHALRSAGENPATLDVLLDAGASLDVSQIVTGRELDVLWALQRKPMTIKRLVERGVLDETLLSLMLTAPHDVYNEEFDALVRTLLDAGADPNGILLPQNFHDAMPPLLRAVEYDCPVAVKYLLDAGANPSCRSFDRGVTPLERAILRGFTRVAHVLIDAKAGLDVANMQGEAPVLLAAQVHRFDLCCALIDAGAVLDDEECTGMRVLDCAVEAGNLPTCRRMLARDLPGMRRWSPLCRAALLGDVAEVQRLLAAGANINARSMDLTPLQCAKRMQHADVAQLLRSAGADEE